jgi:hypothetical protein
MILNQYNALCVYVSDGDLAIDNKRRRERPYLRATC